MDILLVGANGGIGLALLKQCLQLYPSCTLHATYHKSAPDYDHPNVIWYQLNVTQEAEVNALSHRLANLDYLINAVGILHDEQQGPEKNIQSFQQDFFLKNIQINTLPTLLLAKYFTPLLRRSPVAKFATISAKVGSISDNRLGGWYSYRASKAALNMALKTLAIEWQRSVKHGVVLALHPGTTNTGLSKPFQKNVPHNKLFTPEWVAHQLVSIIDQATSEQSGQFIAYDGEVLTW